MDTLPSEIILYLTTFLDTLEIVSLQLVSHRFFHIARDNNLWRIQCFEHSSWEKLRRRREYLANTPNQQPLMRDLHRALGNRDSSGILTLSNASQNSKSGANERIRILANWDPTYPNEAVDWYSEYTHRSAPISLNWLQQPRYMGGGEQYLMEVRGAGVYSPPGGNAPGMVVGPLDDGSICIWDVTGSPGKRGRIIARSTPHTLSTSGLCSGAPRSRMINTGVTECISIDSHQQRAYIAVQSELVEVDLETLKVVSQEKFPFSITVISEAKHTTPITVGTNLSLHLHDPRVNLLHSISCNTPERVDDITSMSGALTPEALINPRPDNYCPLFQPGPLSIVHVPTSQDSWDSSGDIYVAGRFSSILNYDRRYFPKLRSTMFSGARLCSMTSIPYPFAAKLKDRMRHGELFIEEIDAAKAEPGNTLVACGEYNSKGSLELYGLSSRVQSTTLNENISNTEVQTQDFMRNRQTSSDSKLLAVSNHGTRIVVSDGGGNLKWIERDGFTVVREWNIGRGTVREPCGIFGTLGDSYLDNSSGDIVRKILHTKPDADRNQDFVQKDDLILWTGEKLGLLSFSHKPAFTADSFEEKSKSAEDAIKEREERVYGQTMKRALEMQANEVRFVSGLGLSTR